jgi:phage/plasmid-like protein (TIGR03299 family)
MFTNTKTSDVNADATFLGWQKKYDEDIFPLFNITLENHPLYQSTVSEATLRRLHLRVPRIPSPYPGGSEAPWHQAGFELNHPKTAAQALQIAGLDYTVVTKPLDVNPGLKQNAYAATVRTDTGEILGFVREGYEPVQNIDAFAFFDTLVAEDEATYETAGILGNGQCVWVLAKLPGFMKIRGNDIVNKYLLLTNSHDGDTQVRARVTPIRVVCNNTLTAALQGAGDISIQHTPGTVRYHDQGFTILGMSNVLNVQLEMTFNRMAAQKITEEELRTYVQALVPDHEEEPNAERAEKMRVSVLDLHDAGRGADLARGTVWGAFNSVAEYTDHMMAGDDSSARLNAIWFGRGEQLKSKAFSLACRLMKN